MPSALSFDLRSRIVTACQAGELTQIEIADLFQVHLKTVEQLWRHFRRTGSAEAKPHGGGVKAHLAGPEEDLRRVVAEQSDHTLAEYVALLWERQQIATSVPVLSRPLKALGLPQKKALTALEQKRPETERARRRFQAKLSRASPKDLVFVDESGVRTDLTRRYGRAPKGERVREAVPPGRWKVLTILGALSRQGVPASLTVEAATDADVFLAFVEHVLVPTLRPGQIVVMDNLAAHQQGKVRRLLAARRCRLWYWPPYSPDFNPIELAWSKLKTFLRAAKARLRPTLEQAVAAGLGTITAQDARNGFRHCRHAL